MSSGAEIGVRPTDDREGVVILFGAEGDASYYARVTPETALRIAASITKVANAILNIRGEVTH